MNRKSFLAVLASLPLSSLVFGKIFSNINTKKVKDVNISKNTYKFDDLPDMIELPIYLDYDKDKIIGKAVIDKKEINADKIMAFGFVVETLKPFGLGYFHVKDLDRTMLFSKKLARMNLESEFLLMDS